MNCQSATLEVGRRMKWQFGQDEEMANEIDDEGSGWAERFDDGEVWTVASRSVFQTEDEEANRNSDGRQEYINYNKSFSKLKIMNIYIVTIVTPALFFFFQNFVNNLFDGHGLCVRARAKK